MARRTLVLARQIGERLRVAREAAGLTTRQLAHLAHVARTTVDAVSAARQPNPGVGTLCDLAKALGVRPEWLILGVGDGPTKT